MHTIVLAAIAGVASGNHFECNRNEVVAAPAVVERDSGRSLGALKRYPDSSLADLYDPLTMPPDLTKAHQALDRAVDCL